MLKRYDPRQTYEWNYAHPPEPLLASAAPIPGRWQFCGLSVDSPLGIPAGPLLNGAWCLYYASLGYDVLTYKTVRSAERTCYELPNLQPVDATELDGALATVRVSATMDGSWAISFGMPSRAPPIWQADVEWTRRHLPAGKRLVVSVVGTMQPGWSIDQLAADYARCARWAVDSGADAVEANLSCPNVETCDGQLYQHPEQAALVSAAIRNAIGTTPIILKIGPVLLTSAARALVRAVGDTATALAMVNCLPALVVGNEGPLFAGQPRGIGGRAIRAAVVAQLARFAEATAAEGRHLPLIGVGGVSTVQHVCDLLQTGAQHVQLATAAMLDPACALRIRQDWPRSPSG
ncbi:MAG: hypothetical protein AB7F89_02505 [Pirellulaceae bacterium]